MNPEKADSTQVPPLPPSPLAHVEPEGPPEVPLPWSTVPCGALAGLIAGVACLAVAAATAGGPHLRVGIAAHQAGVDAAAALLMVLGAAVSDRLVPMWPRGVRWACGMGAGTLAGAGLPVAVRYLVWGQGAWHFTWHAVGVSAWVTVSYALLGGVLGLVGGSSGGLLWRLPLAGLTAMAALVALHLGVLRLLAGPLLVVGLAGSIMGPILGLLLGFVMAERLNAARRRAMRSRVPES